MSCERALNFDQWKTFSENYKPITGWLWLLYKFTDNNYRLRLFSDNAVTHYLCVACYRYWLCYVYNSWKTAQLSKMVRNNVPLTIQWFEHNALSPEFSGAVSSRNLLEAPSLFREYLIFFFLWFLNHRVFDKFIQFKSCVKSDTRCFYLFYWFHRQLTEECGHGNVSNGHVTQSRLYVFLLQS